MHGNKIELSFGMNYAGFRSNSKKYVCIHTHTYIHMCMYAYIHTYIHTYTHTYIYTYIHTYVRTYIRTCEAIYIYI